MLLCLYRCPRRWPIFYNSSFISLFPLALNIHLRKYLSSTYRFHGRRGYHLRLEVERVRSSMCVCSLTRIV